MALDEALLDTVAANAGLPTLRLYGWERPAITLGRFQNVARTMHLEAPEAHQVPLVRRITGGRGILHGDDLTVTIAAPVEAFGLNPDRPFSAIAVYERIAAAFLAAFARLGVRAAMGSCERARCREARGDCLAMISRADVVEAPSGRKLLGAALHRRERWILQQCSIPLFTPQRRALQAALSRALFRGTNAREEGTEPGFCWQGETLCEAILSGFRDAMGLTFRPDAPTPQERERTGKWMRTRYATAKWNRDASAGGRSHRD
jgi:lipoate-protein ligase A